MHAGARYRLREFLSWTRRDAAWLLAISALPVVLSEVFGWTWVAVPWVPIALIGTAAAFIVGFRNNATYNRLWEARQIYGGIVNTSRAWAMSVCDFVRAAPAGNWAAAGLSEGEAEAARRALVHRHLAWLTALRYQLRQPRAWESMGAPENVEYRRRNFAVEELTGDVGAALAPLLPADEHARVMGRANRAAQIVALQGAQLAALAERGALDPNRHVLLERLLADCYEHQGRCERIKNFPYPRQFATINLFFTRLFVWLLPFGVLGEFRRLGPGRAWLAVPFAFAVGWVFNAMERVGQVTENPFEGGPNDVPVTALSRTIEIDLREMLGEAEVPAPLGPVHDILM